MPSCYLEKKEGDDFSQSLIQDFEEPDEKLEEAKKKRKYNSHFKLRLKKL